MSARATGPGTDGAKARRSMLASPWTWVGVAITVASLGYAFRGVDVREVSGHIWRANWFLLITVSVPAQVLAVHFRALRWRHLTDPVARIETGPLFRATAVGFMANNLFPLRIGEVLRAWYLGRETGNPPAAIFATVVLERVIDTVTFVLLAGGLFFAMGAHQAPSAEAMWLGIPALLIAAVLPLGLMIALRVAPEPLLALIRRVTGFVLPGGAELWIDRQLRRFSEGLGSIKGGTHLLWIAFHSVVIWFVLSALPFVIAIFALRIDLGSPVRAFEAGYATLVAVGLAVSIPSAPGFFGVYHTACRIALGLFGVPTDEAVALGTVSHLLFWVIMTSLGLVCLRWGRTSFDAVSAAAAGDDGQVDSPNRR